MTTNEIHPMLTKRVRELMDKQNITNTAEMRNQLIAYVRDFHPDANPNDSAFYPSDHQISMAIQRHLLHQRYNVDVFFSFASVSNSSNPST